MKPITRTMVHNFRLYKIDCDFMGYAIGNQRNDLSFHHLVVPKRDCKKLGYGDGYEYWNGAILMQSTAHDYLHQIERVDREIFDYITLAMIEENQNGKIAKEDLLKIKDLLLCFEKEHSDDELHSGKKLIKREYITKRKY